MLIHPFKGTHPPPPRSLPPTEKSKIVGDGLVVFSNAILISEGVELHDAKQVLKRRGSGNNGKIDIEWRYQSTEQFANQQSTITEKRAENWGLIYTANRQEICVLGTATFRETSWESTLVLFRFLSLGKDMLGKKE